jgi:hypothetical protein
MNIFPLDRLPNDVLTAHILPFLGDASTLALAATNRHYRALIPRPVMISAVIDHSYMRALTSEKFYYDNDIFGQRFDILKFPTYEKVPQMLMFYQMLMQSIQFGFPVMEMQIIADATLWTAARLMKLFCTRQEDIASLFDEWCASGKENVMKFARDYIIGCNPNNVKAKTCDRTIINTMELIKCGINPKYVVIRKSIYINYIVSATASVIDIQHDAEIKTVNMANDTPGKCMCSHSDKPSPRKHSRPFKQPFPDKFLFAGKLLVYQHILYATGAWRTLGV